MSVTVDLPAAVMVARLFDDPVSEDFVRLPVASAILVPCAVVFARHRPSPGNQVDSRHP